MAVEKIYISLAGKDAAVLDKATGATLNRFSQDEVHVKIAPVVRKGEEVIYSRDLVFVNTRNNDRFGDILRKIDLPFGVTVKVSIEKS